MALVSKQNFHVYTKAGVIHRISVPANVNVRLYPFFSDDQFDLYRWIGGTEWHSSFSAEISKSGVTISTAQLKVLQDVINYQLSGVERVKKLLEVR